MESKKLTLYGSHSKTREPLETRNRFKTLEAGFNFNYKPMTRENAGYILISKFDAENDGTPAIEIWDLKEQVLIHR